MTARRAGGAAALAAAALSLTCCASASTGARAEPDRPPSTSPDPVVAARPAESVLVPEAPVAVTLPSGVVVPIRPAATTADGRLDVPDDTGIAGWWRGGSRVGDPFGSTLVAAHVDSAARGLGPFAELLSVGPGERVVLDSPRLTQTFTVESLRLVPQGSLADEGWLFAPDGRARLTLVTCAPPYDRDRGGYQNLAVVTAVPSTEPSRS